MRITDCHHRRTAASPAALVILTFALLLCRPVGVRPAPAPAAALPPGVSGGFAAFWQAHDGAVLFGEPLTPETRQGALTVQWFERARLEWHADWPAGRQITLGRLGAALTRGRTFAGIAAFPSNSSHRYFAATGHSIQGAFLRFWQAEGGVPVFGYPISEELTEDGRTVQYFERARFESHPELSPAGFPVLPTALGALALGGAAGSALVVEPPVLQEGHTALVQVLAPPGATVVDGSFGGHALTFTCCLAPLTIGNSAPVPWAVAGVVSYQSPDTLPLHVTLRLADGSTHNLERTIAIPLFPYPTYRTIYNGPRTPASTRDTEHATIDAVFAGRSGPPRWSGPFVLPLHSAPDVTAPFGQRRAYNQEPPYEVHEGLDLGAPYGTPVYAPAPGRVVFARTLPLRGNAIIVDHGAGVFTLYAHLEAFRVHVGQEVAAGDLLGLVGATGNALGPHLHWEVHASGPAVQPQEWLSRVFP